MLDIRLEHVRVEGLDAFEGVLKKLPVNVRRRALNSAAAAGARVIRAEMRRRAPVRQEAGVKVRVKGKRGSLPGFLKAAIVVRRSRERGAAAVYHIGPLGQAFYAMFDEFGTRHQPARPFIAPAFDAAAGQAVDATVARLARNLEREVAALAGGLKR